MTFEDLSKEVLIWGKEKEILKPENQLKQMGKMVSEVGELCDQIIKENKTILEWDGKIIADKTLNNSNYKKLGISAGYAKKNGAKPLNGNQLRYIYIIHK